MSASASSTRSSIRDSRNRWWSLKVPTDSPANACSSRPILVRIRARASSARTFGSRSPAIIALIMARPETPKMSLATTESLMQAFSSSFSTRFFSALRTSTRSARYRVRSRNPRIVAVGHETGAQHLPFGDLAQPHGVEHVGFRPTGQMLDVLGVDQPRRQPVSLEQVERCAPVVARGFHHHPLDTQLDQPVRQLAQRPHHRRVRAHLLNPPATAVAGRQPHTAHESRPYRYPRPRPAR